MVRRCIRESRNVLSSKSSNTRFILTTSVRLRISWGGRKSEEARVRKVSGRNPAPRLLARYKGVWQPGVEEVLCLPHAWRRKWLGSRFFLSKTTKSSPVKQKSEQEDKVI